MALALPFARVNDHARWGMPRRNDFVDVLMRMHKLGSEGAIFRNPAVDHYETGRSFNFLRVKLIGSD